MQKNLFIVGWVVAALLSGCGGGGGGGSSNPPATPPSQQALTTSVAALGPNLSQPQNLLLVGSTLYVTDLSGVTALNLTSSTSNLYSATNAIGIGVQSGQVYHTGHAANGYDTVMQLGNPAALVATSQSNNFGAIAFYGTTQQFVANASNIVAYTNFAAPTVIGNLPGAPEGLATDVLNSKIYVTFKNLDSIGAVSLSNLSAGAPVLTQTLPARWGPVTRPSGIVVVGDYAYVVSSGTVAGDHGYISKIHTGTGVTEVLFSESVGTWGNVPAGFCGASGIAVNSTGTAIYVANGTCSLGSVGYGNRNRLLKISIS